MNTEIDVLCIGDLDVDLFISVPAVPGFDQKVAGRNLGQRPGGMSANSAVALSRLGRSTRLLAAVGDDAAGREARVQLKENGVDLQFVKEVAGVNTFMCVILLSPSGEKSLIKLETDAYLPRPEDLVSAAFENVRHVHATYGSAELTLSAFQMAAERAISVSLDLEPPDVRREPQRLSQILKLVDTLFLNSEALEAASHALGRRLEPGMLKAGGEIIVTLGAAGCRRLSSDGTLEASGFAVKAIDTTGAGDCFAGAYLARRLEGADAEESLIFANAAAALATLDYGAQAAMPQRQDVEDFLASSGRTIAKQHVLSRSR
ncbi:carbohydrate kinase family protein [Rhizobium sp. BK251]|uniref:carbohydrate kinase family protein n=1 Tax=Rhizobium sp. BK251 TaxID=2512125 RepID=UPI0010DEF9A8|nr:carbohydrate kinase family protein [Rhizobium sp. BK251]TCL71073.1 ribokinase [Rhizobium sp. BK251]